MFDLCAWTRIILFTRGCPLYCHAIILLSPENTSLAARSKR